VTGVQTCALPISASIYGPNDNFDPQTSHVLAALVKKFLEAKKKKLDFVEIWGSGNVKREFLYVEDLADALYFLMQNYNDPQFINIGVGDDISIKRLAGLIKKITEFDGDIKFNTEKPDGMPRKLVDISKISALGWKPRISLEDGLKYTINWYRKNYAV